MSQMIRSQLRIAVAVILFAALWSVSDALCTSELYCGGRLLDTIQSANLFFDSKTFVDMPARKHPREIQKAFNELFPYNNATADQLKKFVDTYFDPAGSDVVTVEPTDWKETPDFVNSLSDPNLQSFGLAVHAKWKDLLRSFNYSLNCSACYSSIPVPNPFVVAGGRFREYYYWDSFWIIEGLLVSEMYDTARGMIENFLHLVEVLGFVPNGGRVYYENRSQPPLLTQMVWRYYQETRDVAFLTRALPILDAEYDFWMTERVVNINGYALNIFNATNDAPRPESYSEDLQTAEGLSPQDQRAVYANIATGAETGWDFSSRWFADGRSLRKIVARNIVPVDLNNIVYLNEVRMADMYSIVGNDQQAAYYSQAALNRSIGMMSVLWNNKNGQWNDFNYVTKKHTAEFYPSNIMPLWSKSYQGLITDAQLKAFVDQIMGIFSFPGGVPTSLSKTGQQWDFPNAWPPLQYFVIEAFDNMGPNTNGAEIAFKLAERWITSNYCGWNETMSSYGGLMFEKYNAETVGIPGHGGEYPVQAGFGWTNGVVLHLLKKYGPQLTLGSCA
eukprot:TRINITY_DN6280_c0_g1_i1.p1 TRINITY_DN6280_c0_g1~~TRINITY_DN6280_c0_g1_i1.p1  ORF type:complete len:559 (+),score=124.46 TRINITY_DN6280_c0_g1_i1:77-1753(+)